MYDFTYSKPASLADALKVLGEDMESKALAGGQDVHTRAEAAVEQADADGRPWPLSASAGLRRPLTSSPLAR